MKRCRTVILAAALSFIFTACQSSSGSDENGISKGLGLTPEIKDATKITMEINSAVYSMLDFSNTQQAEFATKGLIDAPEKLELKDKEGKVIWSQKAYSFLNDYDKAPSTVNPSLWENTKNNHAYGLFEVMPGIYQVRGYDMANLTLVKGDTGWIIFDPLMSVECTVAAMELVRKNLGDFPVKAVIISHPHIDHYGGIKGVMSEEQAADPALPLEQQIASGKIPIIVPFGFTEHAVSENVYVGQAMGRRAGYQYGTYLIPGEKGKLAMGIGMGQSIGTISFILPSFEIKETGTNISIDGINMEFQMTPGTEAPAEMNTWFPDKKAAAQDNYIINVTLTDTNQKYLLRLKNGALLYSENGLSAAPNLSITCPKNALFLISKGDVDKVEKVVKMEGDSQILYTFMKNLNQFNPGETPKFDIIEP